MADDLRFGGSLSIEPSYLYPSLHYASMKGDHFIEKTKLNLQVQEREPIEDCHLELDDVLMLDDIREFSMENGFTNTDIKLTNVGPSLSPPPLKESVFSSLEKYSSQIETPPLNSPDEYLPGTSDTSHNDTFQDLSIFMFQGSSMATTSNVSLKADSYSTCKTFSDNSSSSTQFTNISYSNETLSVAESPCTEFKSISSETSNSDVKNYYTETKVFKHAKHRDMRKKNNIASQRSRMTRKEREREMENKEKFLEQENQMLRIKVSKLEELTGALKNKLFKSVLGK